jgi:hypothetical protein
MLIKTALRRCVAARKRILYPVCPVSACNVFPVVSRAYPCFAADPKQGYRPENAAWSGGGAGPFNTGN